MAYRARSCVDRLTSSPPKVAGLRQRRIKFQN
nr:MAG TPA: hypothetical protein [Caudoviricetes sp.]